MSAITHTEDYGMFRIPHFDDVVKSDVVTPEKLAVPLAAPENMPPLEAVPVATSVTSGATIIPEALPINGTLAPKAPEKPASADVSSGEMAKNLLVKPSATMSAVPRPQNIYAELLEIGEEIERCRLRNC